MTVSQAKVPSSVCRIRDDSSFATFERRFDLGDADRSCRTIDAFVAVCRYIGALTGIEQLMTPAVQHNETQQRNHEGFLTLESLDLNGCRFWCGCVCCSTQKVANRSQSKSSIG